MFSILKYRKRSIVCRRQNREICYSTQPNLTQQNLKILDSTQSNPWIDQIHGHLWAKVQYGRKFQPSEYRAHERYRRQTDLR